MAFWGAYICAFAVYGSTVLYIWCESRIPDHDALRAQHQQHTGATRPTEPHTDTVCGARARPARARALPRSRKGSGSSTIS